MNRIDGWPRRPTAHDLRVLREAASSTSAPAHVTRRARLALDAELASRDPAAQAGPTDDRWLRRYLEDGLDGLADQPRSGRPRHIDRTIERETMLAPLFAPNSKWTTRSVAEQVGISQSSVSRIWRQAFDPEPHDAIEAALPSRASLQGAYVTRDFATLFVGTSVEPSTNPSSSAARVRPALQTVLAAQLLARRITTASPVDDLSTMRQLAEAIDAATWRRSHGLVITSRPLPDEVLAGLEMREIVVADTTWQGLLDVLDRAIDPLAQPHLLLVQAAVRTWAKDPREPFAWRASSNAPLHTTSVRPPRSSLSTRPGRTAASVLESIQEALIDGRFRPGDRITESYVSRALKLSRQQVHEAMVSLAADGLVMLQPDRGITIPETRADDVLETYAARRALGTLIVRRLCSVPRQDLAVLHEALAHVKEVALTGDVWDTSEADFRFQDLMADASSMRRIPSMFRRLGTQIHLFVSILGVQYGYPPAMSVEHLEALMKAIDARDEDLAAEIWVAKMRDAVAYLMGEIQTAQSRRR